MYRVVPEDAGRTSIAIGKPIANAEVWVLGEAGELVPAGVPGEVWVGGAGLGRGYLHEPQLTQDRFLDHPFRQGQRLYRTGDLGRWLPDGNLAFLGRSDQQVKVRGYRIELGEIEHLIQQSGLVQQGVVLAPQAPDGNRQLVGYLVAHKAFEVGPLVAFLAAHLPAYLVPSRWRVVERLPLTANGKVDKKALVEAQGASPVGSQDYQPPGTDLEQGLVEAWQQVLGCERVGVQDNFFALGGHSLLATRLVSSLRKRFMKEISIKDVFDHPTVARLANHLLGQQQISELPLLVAQERPERVPLSFAQERLWFLDQLSGSRHYHIPSVLLLQGPLRADLLQEAFRLLLERHQPLRTRIEHHQGRPCQHLLAARHWQLHLPAASHLAAGSPLLQARIDALIDQPFELSRDYPLRASLLQLQPRQHVLVLTLHHIAADGWSWSILTGELSLLYQALLEGQDPQLPQLPLQYADFALWQRSPAHQHQLEQDLSYWQQKLHALAPQQLPADFARPARAATRASSVQASLPADLHQALLAYCHQQGASLFMGLLAALKALLFRYCQQQDLCVGSPIAGRELAQTQSLVGLFVNTLALRTQLHGQMSFEQLLQAVKTTTLQAYHHQQAPFEQVVQRLAPHRQAGHNPLFQLMLALQNTPSAPGLQLAGLQASPLPLPQGPAKFDLLLTCWQAEGGSLDCRLEYCPDLFAAGRMQALLVHFRQLLEALLQAPHSPLCRLPMLTPREQQVLAGLSVNPTPYPSQLTLVDLFARQLHQRPHQPALVSPHQPPLSYQQLDARSNQLAHLLLARGLQAEQAVGLCLERGNELIVSLLAVLKAGGAYLPLDPSYPTARLGHMLEKAAWPLVVTCPASRGSLPPDYPGPVLCLQAHQPLISRQPTLPPQSCCGLSSWPTCSSLPARRVSPRAYSSNTVTWLPCSTGSRPWPAPTGAGRG